MKNEPPEQSGAAWRAEVASRVTRYRARRKRNPDAESAAFDFGSTPALPESRPSFDTNYYRRANTEVREQLAPPLTASTAPATELDPAPEAPAAAVDLDLRPEELGIDDDFLNRYRIAFDEPQPATDEPAGKLILFPSPLLEPMLPPAPSPDELAEPVVDRPRILDVPEEIMPMVQGSLFPEIRLDAEAENAPPQPEFEVPLPVARLSERTIAGLVDAGVVAAGGILFAAIAWMALPEVPHGKPFWMALGAVTVLFWAVYQHLFLLYRGATLGMISRGIRLGTFDGSEPDWKQRGCRARFLFISLVSVGLGFAWALVDEDTLCWHDRISRTFPTRN
jgi:uncharacterized RDD family membrane protein YckC